MNKITQQDPSDRELQEAEHIVVLGPDGDIKESSIATNLERIEHKIGLKPQCELQNMIDQDGYESSSIVMDTSMDILQEDNN